MFEIINPRARSKRLIFIKDGSRWHICDVSLWRMNANEIEYIALHGEWMKNGERVDSVSELDNKKSPSDVLCEQCLTELNAAKEIIAANDMLKF